MNHILLIRSTFRNKTLFESYLEVAKEVLFPQLNAQTNKNFTVCFLTNCNEHSEIISSFINDDVKKVFILDPLWKTEFKNYVKENFFDIQTRHDFDDWMSLDYVEKIQNTWQEFKNNNLNNTKLLIHSQPMLFDFNKKLDKEMNGKYDNKFISMHLSLCQNENNYYVFQDIHSKMYKLTENIILLPKGYTKLVIHNNNMLSDINC